MKIDPNAPAFPVATESGPFAVSTLGLTIRAELAAQICAGLCADRANLKDLDAHVTKERGASQVLAVLAVGMADSLIAELNK